ncbi:prolyl oligopeptidase family serine peptidase [Nocardioides mesophilus]|uniref:Prolyl oligopeptidase family serine peptidase n=1 Tax=Nocardioides mesophilus TaxID=433659 RepID=A0A7G9RCF9_9ACTN|nr:prolyl oligopeptidase family serine peptidase [Nocardioides mesophilus]QNN53284.1 prolyl oligopeptidase family serine peptidase [Nocardioides mesophilus]
MRRPARPPWGGRTAPPGPARGAQRHQHAVQPGLGARAGPAPLRRPRPAAHLGAVPGPGDHPLCRQLPQRPPADHRGDGRADPAGSGAAGGAGARLDRPGRVRLRRHARPGARSPGGGRIRRLPDRLPQPRRLGPRVLRGRGGPAGLPEDLVNAVRAVRRADLPFVDASRVGLFGRSMGGGVVLEALAAVPDLADAAVLYSPVSSLAADGFDRWVRPDPGLRARVVAAYGSPRSRPGVWRRASARSYAERIEAPLLVAHGTADQVCPVAWSRATVAAVRAAGGHASLQEYRGEGHGFGDSWPLMMRRSVDFLAARLL